MVVSTYFAEHMWWLHTCSALRQSTGWCWVIHTELVSLRGGLCNVGVWSGVAVQHLRCAIISPTWLQNDQNTYVHVTCQCGHALLLKKNNTSWKPEIYFWNGKESGCYPVGMIHRSFFISDIACIKNPTNDSFLNNIVWDRKVPNWKASPGPDILVGMCMYHRWQHAVTMSR